MIEVVAKFALIGLGFVALVLVMSAIMALPVWLLWNWLCPKLFGLPLIGFFQAWGLSCLCGCLFKSSGKNKSD